MQNNSQKKNRPVNYTIKTRATTSLEEQTYLQTVQDTEQSREPEIQTADNNLQETEDHSNQTGAVESNPTADTTTEPQISTTDNTVEETVEHQDQTSAEHLNNDEASNTNTERILSDHPIMATGFSLPKFNGSESPVIWLSKLDAWQTFHNYADQKILAMLPCALEGSASTWFQTLQPPCNSLTTFKKQLTDRFQPILYGMPLMGIRQDPSETMDQYLERAERISMIHDMAELYKVQAIASGLLPPWRGKVLSREPKSFPELRNTVSKVQVELSDLPQNLNHSSDHSLANLCTTLATQMTELTKSIKADISALRVNSEPDHSSQQRWTNQHGGRPRYHNNRRDMSQRSRQYEREPREYESCKGCGKSCPIREKCPAFNTKCTYCFKWHHYESVCFKKQRLFNKGTFTNTNPHSSS